MFNIIIPIQKHENSSEGQLMSRLKYARFYSTSETAPNSDKYF